MYFFPQYAREVSRTATLKGSIAQLKDDLTEAVEVHENLAQTLEATEVRGVLPFIKCPCVVTSFI